MLGSLGSILIIWLAAGVLLYEGASRIVTLAPTLTPTLTLTLTLNPTLTPTLTLTPRLYEGASRIVMTLHISPYISTYLRISPGASRIVMTLIAGHAMVSVDGGAMAPSPTPS